MSFDTKYTYNPLPYNIADKNNANNRNGDLPSFQYKKRRILWLNTAYATSNVNNGGTIYYEFSFDIPPFQVYNMTKLTIISVTSNENTVHPLYIKLKNLNYDVGSTFCSDKEAFPMLFVAHFGANGMMNNNIYSLTLLPQLINNITLKINDSFTNRDTGFSISSSGAGHLLIALLLENDDLVPDNVVSPYK
jgi:hypothetical protein